MRPTNHAIGSGYFFPLHFSLSVNLFFCTGDFQPVITEQIFFFFKNSFTPLLANNSNHSLPLHTLHYLCNRNGRAKFNREGKVKLHEKRMGISTVIISKLGKVYIALNVNVYPAGYMSIGQKKKYCGAISWSHDHPKTMEALKILQEKNPNSEKNSPAGMVGVERRFFMFNGAIGKEQLEWLDKILQVSTKHEEKVVVCCHMALDPRATQAMKHYVVIMMRSWK
ncbi:hypothetical protein IFM89_027561 [Coptis chinensis]|uniref:Uncharacterized protein n=1 Tax=Coptis chinensis TaxID=261450 RepID=A0A835HQ67_9MAGN|nr:hypothetical protein IFM89_027561 [Coptis chinensis]